MFEIDFLADTWRWWAAMGSLMGIAPVSLWIARFVRTRAAVQPFSVWTRFFLAMALLFGLVANLVAGAIIPLANEGRVSGFDQSHPLFDLSLGLAWFFWGLLSWSIAIAFAKSPWRMAGASIAWWAAVYVAADLTIGAQL